MSLPEPYYQDEAVTIYHGDCLEIMPHLPKVDAVVTDPPYGLSGSSGTINLGRRKALYHGSWKDDLDAVRTVFVPAVEMALTKSGGRGAVTTGKPNAFEYPKPCDIGAILQPASVGLGKWGACDWQPVLFYGRDPLVGKRIQRTTFKSNGSFLRSGHPCPKPDDIAIWMVSRASVVGETILDPFAGSGTLLRAAKDLGRKAIGIDIEERYCEIAAKRMSQEVLPL